MCQYWQRCGLSSRICALSVIANLLTNIWVIQQNCNTTCERYGHTYIHYYTNSRQGGLVASIYSLRGWGGAAFVRLAGCWPPGAVQHALKTALCFRLFVCKYYPDIFFVSAVFVCGPGAPCTMVLGSLWQQCCHEARDIERVTQSLNIHILFLSFFFMNTTCMHHTFKNQNSKVDHLFSYLFLVWYTKGGCLNSLTQFVCFAKIFNELNLHTVQVWHTYHTLKLIILQFLCFVLLDRG